YRTPVVPVLSVAAASGLAALFRLLRKPGRRSAILPGAPGAAAAVLSSAFGPFPQEKTDYAAEMYYCLGVDRSEDGDLSGAEGFLRRAVELRPDYADAHNSLGVVHERSNRPVTASEHYAEAVRHDSANVTARLNLANMLYERNMLARAAEEYAEVIRIAPANLTAHNRLGLSWSRLGQPARAAEHFANALRIDPRNADMHNNLASAYRQVGRADEAEAHYRAALAIAPGLTVAVDNLADLLIQEGRHAEAEDAYRRALDHARRAELHGLAQHCERRMEQIRGGDTDRVD
ncbi:tetratricopeptide repeat protein, partial [Verrucomicrobiota bacterium]